MKNHKRSLLNAHEAFGRPNPCGGPFKSFCNALESFCNGIPSEMIFANEAREEMTITANPMDDAIIEANESGWYRLSAYGSYPNYKGEQKMDIAAANTMVDAFNSAAQRVKRFVTGNAGQPVFRGHPDDPDFSKIHEDQQVYGRVDQMEARDDGFYVHIAWANEVWDKLKTEKKWRMSPRWVMRRNADGTYSPKKLVSIGLTDKPNMEDAPFANSKNTNMNPLLKLLLTKLKFSEARIEATEKATSNAISETEATTALDAVVTAANAATETAKKETADAKAETEKAKADLTAANTKLKDAETSMSNERKARAKLYVDGLVASGKITAAQREETEKKLTEATDFETVSNEVSKKEPALHTTSQFGDQGKRRPDESVMTASNEMRSKVYERMNRTGEDYDHAWNGFAATAEGKKLLETMGKKPTE